MLKRNDPTNLYILTLFILMLVFPACSSQDDVRGEDLIIGTWHFKGYTDEYRLKEKNYVLQLSEDNAFKFFIDGEIVREGTYKTSFYKDNNMGGYLSLLPGTDDPISDRDLTILDRNLTVPSDFRLSEDGDILHLNNHRLFSDLEFKRVSDDKLAAVMATPSPTPTPTATPVPIPPTPTVDFEALLPDALKLCESSVDKSSAGELPGSKVLVLINEQGDWELLEDYHSTTPAFMEPRLLSEVAALVCIRVDRKIVGRYSDGAAAHQIYWNVQVVSWPDGQQIASNKFVGGDPPEVKSGSGSASGRKPYEDYQTWLKSLLPSPERLVIALTGHTDRVSSVAFSPDGKLLASGSDDLTVKLWDVATGEEMTTLTGHTHNKTYGHSSVNSVAFLPNGKLLASAGHDGKVKLWDVEAGEEITTLTGHKGIVFSVAFSPDGKWLASGTRDHTVQLWDANTRVKMRDLTDRTMIMSHSVVFSPNGKLLASGGLDGTAKLWDVETGEEVVTLIGNTDNVHSIDFSPNGKLLALGGEDNPIPLLDVSEW